MNDIVQSLQFNLLYATQGNLFGIGSYIGMDLNQNSTLLNTYGDFVGDTNGTIDAITEDPIPSFITNNVRQDLRVQTTEQDMITSNAKYNLLGNKYLPWSAEVLKAKDGNYYFISTSVSWTHDIQNDTWSSAIYTRKKFNELRKEVLIMKLQSMLIIGGSLLGTYYVIKFFLKQLLKRI